MTLAAPPRRRRAPASPTGHSGHGGGWRLGLPFTALHLSCLAVVFVGWSPVALGACGAMYLTRIFGITAFYHRCLSHRAFKVSRGVQLCGALLGAAAAQRGPLWWAAHHRRHHRVTDRPGDPHSPVQGGLAYSHMLWMFAPANRAVDTEVVADLAAYPELRVLDRFHHVVPALCALWVLGLGAGIAHLFPSVHTSGPQLVVWGFCISTVLVYQATFAVNSVGHALGRRTFDTTDDSRNVWWLALMTLGEGWHNNHHRFPGAARSGFARRELDPTWLALAALERLGLVRDLRPVPAGVLATAQRRHAGKRR